MQNRIVIDDFVERKNINYYPAWDHCLMRGRVVKIVGKWASVLRDGAIGSAPMYLDDLRIFEEPKCEDEY